MTTQIAAEHPRKYIPNTTEITINSEVGHTHRYPPRFLKHPWSETGQICYRVMCEHQQNGWVVSIQESLRPSWESSTVAYLTDGRNEHTANLWSTHGTCSIANKMLTDLIVSLSSQPENFRDRNRIDWETTEEDGNTYYIIPLIKYPYKKTEYTPRPSKYGCRWL